MWIGPDKNVVEQINIWTDLWVNNLHNDGEENSKPSLSKEVVQNKTAKCSRWGEVQRANSQRSSYDGAGRKEPQAGGQTKGFY